MVDVKEHSRGLSSKLYTGANDSTPEELAMANANYKLLKDGFCKCGVATAMESVYFRDSKTGSHGWMCKVCRRATQYG